MAFLGPSLRRKRITDRPAARVAAAALVSLVLNALMLVVVARLGGFELTRSVQPTRIALESLSPEQWQKNRAIAGSLLPQAVPPPVTQPPPEPAARAPEVKLPPDETKAPGQIVDVAPSKDSRPPDKARFASDRDSRVEKETRSRWAGTQVWEKRAPAPVAGGKGQERPAGDGGNFSEARQAKAGEGGTNGKAGKEGPKEPAPAGADERLAMLERPQQPGAIRPGEPRPQAGDEGLGKPGAPGERQDGQRKTGDPRLLPSVESMSRIAAGPSADYIDRDVEEGDATALNTRAFKFATFWNRFKQDVVGHWRPSIVYQERDPDGTMFGSRSERATELHVVLDSTGALRDIKVVEASGLDFLDREAVRAVRAAAPFYNVPGGLLDEKGEVSFSFGMVLVMDRAIPIRPQYGGRR